MKNSFHWVILLAMATLCSVGNCYASVIRYDAWYRVALSADTTTYSGTGPLTTTDTMLGQVLGNLGSFAHAQGSIFEISVGGDHAQGTNFASADGHVYFTSDDQITLAGGGFGGSASLFNITEGHSVKFGVLTPSDIYRLDMSTQNSCAGCFTFAWATFNSGAPSHNDTFVVDHSIPEPPTLVVLMFGLGLVGLGFVRTNRNIR